MGGDYLRYSITAQKELLFALKTKTFPLYLPGFAGGHSSSAATLGQLFHPISHIASLMPGYWDGLTVDWNNFFKLLSLGLTHLVLFAFLLEIRLNIIFAFILSFIAMYNLRYLYAYQYGAASEAYTGYFMLCAAIGWYYIRKPGWTGASIIIIATYLLVCSGHPEEVYYGVFGSILFTLIAPFFLSGILGEKLDYKKAIKFWLIVGSYISAGILLSSAYIIPFYSEFLKSNVSRVGRNYAWANMNLDSFIGTLNNFFLPLHSMPHTAFGGSSLILIPMLLPLIRVFKKKIPCSVWVLWGILIFIFLHMQGYRTPVHRWVWEYLPFASSIRVPGRISIIMPFFLMMLMAWIIKIDLAKKSSHFPRPLTILAIVSTLLLAIYYVVQFLGTYIFKLPLFLKYFNPYYYDRNFLYISPSLTFFRVELILTILGILSIIILIFYNSAYNKRISKISGVILVILVIFQVNITLRYRSINWIQQNKDFLTFEVMKTQKREKLDHRYYQGSGWHSSVVIKQLKYSFMEPFLGKIFTEVIPVSDQNEVYRKMWGARLPQQIFIEGYSLERAEDITNGARNMKEGRVELIYSSYNRLKFRVYSQSPAIFGFSYPYTGHWRAWVNGEKVKVYRANGAAHAVEVPEGDSIVEFRYWSNAYSWGMVISCTTFVLIGGVVGFGRFRGLKRAIIIMIIIVIGAGGFMLWFRSLYNGKNLETEYTWTYISPSGSPNLAYGKKNWINTPSVKLSETYRELELYKGLIIDGNREPGSGFITCYYDSPAWIVDLSQEKHIKKILFYYSNKVPDFLLLRNCSVFEGKQDYKRKIYDILMSKDGENWEHAGLFVIKKDEVGVKEVVFQNFKTARFVQVRLRGRGQLSFDEIEIY
jgi:hypothetical protein